MKVNQFLNIRRDTCEGERSKHEPRALDYQEDEAEYFNLVHGLVTPGAVGRFERTRLRGQSCGILILLLWQRLLVTSLPVVQVAQTLSRIGDHHVLSTPRESHSKNKTTRRLSTNNPLPESVLILFRSGLFTVAWASPKIKFC